MGGFERTGQRPGCPDPEQIAAHAEHRLDPEEASRLDEHIAGCPDCYQVFSETVQWALAEAPAAGASPKATRAAFYRRPLFQVAAVLAIAAVPLVYMTVRPRRDRAAGPLVAELAEAMGTRRFVEPRLTGGFRHGRLVTLRSGEVPQGLDTQPAAVLAAVARIRARAEGDTSPEALGALGVTYLVSGDAAAAVKTLESASAQQPEDARLLSDLAAAYLVRASRLDEPADLPKALEAAEKAVASKDAPEEAWFNRALALERLHLVDAARKAWQEYLERDSGSGWAEEARRHLEALPAKQASREEDGTRARAALAGGEDAIDRLAEEEPQLLRDHLDRALLPAWAEAYLVGHPDARIHGENARLVGEALHRTTGDALPREAARALSEAPSAASSVDPIRSQALGYRAFREGARLYDLQQPSCAPFREAVAAFEAGGSPYAAWARQQTVAACLFSSDQEAAMADLGRLESLAESNGYHQVLGRVRWLQGLIHGYRAELTRSLESYRSARASFQATRDAESEASVLVRAAESLQLAGEPREAWRERERSLALIGRVTNPRRRHMLIDEAASACLDAQLPRCALHFETALVEAAVAWSSPMAVREALTRRGSIAHALDADTLAAADVAEARRWIARIGDADLARRAEAETDAAEGEMLVDREPEAASRVLERSLAYFRETIPTRVPALHLLLARAEAGRGLAGAAEEQLLAGIRAMEGQRSSLRDAGLQLSFFDQALPLFDDMVRLQVTTRHDPERALAFVERGRARQLLDALSGAGPGKDPAGGDSAALALAPLDPEALRRGLPDDVALVYHLALDDRLFAWVLDRGGCHFVERAAPSATLSRLVAAHRAAVEGRGSLADVRRTGGRLHDELIRPLAPFIAGKGTVVLIPDGVLQSVAFASLWDRGTGRYLVEEHRLGLAPSGTVFVRASAAGAARPGLPGQALVVGNPRFDRRTWTGLPDLPGAEAEATAIAALYRRAALLTRGGATRAQFLDGIGDSQVVHFAGHAAANAGGAAQLLLAPDANDSGALHLGELEARRLARTRVVVLAACRTAAGPVSRVEGALSLGRPLLAAGVPNVVASLWDVDDALSRRFFVALHRRLLVERDPLAAVRQAQIDLLQDGDPVLSHPASWAVFVSMGGIPLVPSKGEVS